MAVRSVSVLNSVARTVSVVGSATRRRDAVTVFVATGVAYLLVYLYAIGNLSYQPGISFEVLLVDSPLSRAFEPGPGRFAYEPVAIVDLWIVRYLFSPINTTIGLGLSLLVGANLSLSYLAIVQPKACGIGTSSGLLASIPAVLAGGACCAPVLLLVLGITAGGTLLTIITWLLPLGVLLLIGSLIYLARRINPSALIDSR